MESALFGFAIQIVQSLLFLNFKLLAGFCDSTGRFVSDLVGNVDGWFSDALAQMLVSVSNHKQGSVVQNFVSLTLSLSPQFVNYISTSKANTLLFFVEKM